MGCVKSASHTSSNPLPPSSVNKTTNFGSSVPFNKNLTLISSHQAFQPDPGYVESRRKKFAEFAMHFRIESVVNIINQSIPFESVTELDLKQEKCCLPQVDYLQVFPHLQNLNLSINSIEQIRNLSLLSNLTVLNLSYNQINTIHNLHRLTQLKQLYLHNNEIKKIQGLQTLVNLVELSLGANKINKIKKLSNLVNLQILGLEMNKIQKIQNLQNLKSLRLLTLGGNKIQRIQNIQSLNNLQILSLEDNKISKIENIYSMVEHLKEVKLEHNLINLQEEDFTIRQIALTGTLIYVSSQKTDSDSILKSFLPKFVK